MRINPNRVPWCCRDAGTRGAAGPPLWALAIFTDALRTAPTCRLPRRPLRLTPDAVAGVIRAIDAFFGVVARYLDAVLEIVITAPVKPPAGEGRSLPGNASGADRPAAARAPGCS